VFFATPHLGNRGRIAHRGVQPQSRISNGDAIGRIQTRNQNSNLEIKHAQRQDPQNCAKNQHPFGLKTARFETGPGFLKTRSYANGGAAVRGIAKAGGFLALRVADSPLQTRRRFRCATADAE